MQNYAVRIQQPGGPEQLVIEEIAVPMPAAGEVLVRNSAIGVNFIDTYLRSGLYPMPAARIPGAEGAGVVEALGARVTEFAVGDRVAYVDPFGAYSLLLTRPNERLVKIPDTITDELAAACLLKGITAHYLLHSTYPVKAGETILVHAAAGGVGQILCQWAAKLGATVIGTVGSDAKVDIARKAGCQHVLNTANGGVAASVREITAGRGVPVVYDGIGKVTFFDSLDCLSARGLMVSFGNASGAVEPVAVSELAQRGSLYLTRPSLNAYIPTAAELRLRAAAVFDGIANGWLSIDITSSLPLKQAATAHANLEARKTTGSTVLIP